MNEMTMFEAQEMQLETLCNAKDFTYRFRRDVYPICLTIRPVQGISNQLSILEGADGSEYISPNASITWMFVEDKVISKIEGGNFTISDDLYRKFTSVFKKMALYWQQYVFRYLIKHGSVSVKGLQSIGDAEEEMPQDLPDDLDEEV